MIHLKRLAIGAVLVGIVFILSKIKNIEYIMISGLILILVYVLGYIINGLFEELWKNLFWTY